MTVKQVAVVMRVDPETVRRWIRTGKLPAEKSSRKEGFVITNIALLEFVSRCPRYSGLMPKQTRLNLHAKDRIEYLRRSISSREALLARVMQEVVDLRDELEYWEEMLRRNGSQD